MATQSYTLRIPVELMAALNSLADGSSEGKAAIVVRALRREIECGGSSVVEQRQPVRDSAGSIPAPRSTLGQRAKQHIDVALGERVDRRGKNIETDVFFPVALLSKSAPRAGKLRVSTSCPDCSALNGMHQRWCKTKVS